MNVGQNKQTAQDPQKAGKMPMLFIGHGNPMNAIEKNRYSQDWSKLATRLPRPSAVLSISAHWLTRGTAVHVGKQPATIHDFWGFPRELYAAEYACPGAPELAEQVRSLIRETVVASDRDWGLDHGTWVPLTHLIPAANIPVFQLSIDMTRPAEFHYQIGIELAPLRDRGVLIIGSGNIVHNLGRANFDRDSEPYPWAVEFDELSRDLLVQGDHRALISYEELGPAAALSVPTPDHYWPLLYILGLVEKDDSISFPVNGIAHSSVSMRTIAYGL